MYKKGRGVECPSDVKAAAWYRKAAIQGHSSAQYNLAGMCCQGRGVAQSDDKATAWYLKATLQGLAPAPFNLGCRYHDGIGVVQNFNEAAAWWSKAALQGHVGAQAELASLDEASLAGAVNSVYAFFPHVGHNLCVHV
jgi:TPR repeat protein